MSLRDYRVDIEEYPFFNKEAQGIALFDLVISFIVAYMIIDFFVPKYIKNRGCVLCKYSSFRCYSSFIGWCGYVFKS